LIKIDDIYWMLFLHPKQLFLATPASIDQPSLSFIQKAIY